MSAGKWFSDLKADTPLPVAARKVLKVRLEVVGHCLHRALEKPEKDPEYVHQLRVGIRRAVAALDIFTPCLRKKTYRKTRKRLRKLRRAAGTIRDWDVFLESWAGREPPPSVSHPEAGGRFRRGEPGMEFLIGYAVSQRQAAQVSLQEASQAIPSGFEKLASKVLAAIRKPADNQGADHLVGVARPLLADLVKQLEKTARSKPRSFEKLHGLRIIGKRLRYAMEVFAGCFPPAFQKKLYPMVEELQEFLGEAVDSQVASEIMASLKNSLRSTQPAVWKRCRPAFREIIAEYRRRWRQERGRLPAWWNRWQESGASETFASLLKK
jgi:CHAD domain-containing protein